MALVPVERPAAGGRRAGLAALVLLIVTAAAGVVRAQISPGDLSAAHAVLEGSAHCLSCHGQRKRVDPALCLECHAPLARRIDAGLGLHARPGYGECATCHIEHHGREFELVWWGEAGEAEFDHDQAGYALEGAHARASCRDCHRPESITGRDELESQGKDLTRTFLGLDPACLGCHRDEHRGQTAAGGCLSCHTLDAWLPPSLFDHDRARFGLTGRHRDAECTDCHEMLAAPEPPGESYLALTVPAFGRCSDCHEDPHRSRLGERCSSCHGTGGWRLTDAAAFDHDRTRFRLLGRHRELACAACHPAGDSLRAAPFERCSDCHEDSHLGQFAAGPGGGECDSCHEVRGFTPSTFGLERHQESAYPLAGAHLAVPCDACHQRLETGELARLLGREPLPLGSEPVATSRFRFAATACRDCHANPHGEEVSQLVADGGCESCHSLAGWQRIDFDHEQTGYPLEGAHRTPACEECHDVREAEPGEARVRMVGAPTSCAGCHRDPHLGQFAGAGGEVDCRSCHGIETWREVRFDHQVDSVFALEGAHGRVECGQCHPRETVDGHSFTRFKPLATECAACHADTASAGAGAG